MRKVRRSAARWLRATVSTSVLACACVLGFPTESGAQDSKRDPPQCWSPEMLAALSGLMKDFFDRTYYPALERINGRPYAILICAGSDGQNAARQIARIATGWRLRAIADPIIVCTHAQTPEAIFAPKVIGSDDLSRCEELGATCAAGLSMGVF